MPGSTSLWIEMEHSPLGLPGCGAHDLRLPRCLSDAVHPMPDATEGDIQKATDIGALGIIIPTVDTVEKAEAAVKWTKFRRSAGAAREPASTATSGARTTVRPPMPT